ncbi:OLC1v1028467C1 [Oldenlandia corymbosa var. corymbosa]|uniref:OLC1v1028467C1 n=1 Tax=Oldenlandia corymbosa var. corymbosa TaxID=529605 RepID=A0AAV1CC15_OLDCO|nr:OLC1v1028467C1 [Oldenlandia corymbosa var. corymbosa]
MKLPSWISSSCSSETATSIAKHSMINSIPAQKSVLFSDSSSFSDINQGNGSSSSSSCSSTSQDSSDSNSSLQSSLSIATHPSIPSLQKLSPESFNLSVKTLSITSLKSPENAAIVNSLQVHDNLLFAVSGSQVSVFDVNNNLQLLHTFNNPHNKKEPSPSSSSPRGSIKSLAFIDGKIFTAHQDCKIRAWELKPKQQQYYKQIATLPTMEDFFRNFILPKNYIKVRRHKKKLWVQHFDAVSSLAVDNNNLLYSVSWDKYLKIWSGKDFRCLESIKAHDDAINAIVVSHDGLVYTGSADKKIKVWGKPLGEKKNVLIATLEKHKSAVNALALSSDGSVLFSGSNDRSILVWEKEDSANHMVVSGALRGHGKAILCLIHVSDLLFSGSADRTVRIWHRAFDGRYCCLTVLEGHAKPVRSLAAAEGEVGGGMTVFSGSFDGEIKVWKVVVSSDLKTSEESEDY